MSIRITPESRGWVLEAEQVFPLTREAIFGFFADAANLEAITPDDVQFRILTPPPITMREGCRIDYRLRVQGVPVRWQSEITVWDPPHRFMDVQRRGPYRWWRHEHEFIEEGSSTRMRDRVEYGVPGGAVIHRLFVQRQLRKIFAHRRRVLAESFGSP